ncbi:MAG: SRPBCC family protein [Tepidisphaeraceae bacterium]
MRWLLFVGMAIGVIVLVVVLVGLMLPKSHRATRMAEFKQCPEGVFATITGSQDWRGVTKIELPSDDGLRRWREQSGNRSITFEEAVSDPPRLYRSRIADKNLPFSGTWTWEITATGDGCACRITEYGEVYNLIFRIMSRFVFGYTKTIDDYLNALGRKFNEPVKIEN